MKSKSEFWERVHLALDERRDPLEDVGVQDAIAAEPELLDDLIALRSRLDALPLLRSRLHALPIPRQRTRLSLVAAAAAVAIAAGAIAFYFSRTPSAAVEPIAVLVPPTQPSFAHNEILDFELSITTERPGERDTVVIDRTGTRRTREFGRDAFEHSTLTTEVLTPRGR